MTTDPCQERRFDPAHPSGEAARGAKPANVVERDALRRLPSQYDYLAEALKELVDARRVIIVEYFDPLDDADGSPCHNGLPGITRTEAGWAQTDVMSPLK